MTDFFTDIGELQERFNILGAFWGTIQLTLWAALWAVAVGTVVAILRLSPVAVLRGVGTSFVTLFRNTPLTLIVVGTQIVLFQQLQFNLAERGSPTFITDNNFRVAVLALAAYHAAFVCEALRSGVNTIPVGQAEAARSIGLTFGQSLRQVILPQAFRGAITPIGNVLIALTKNTTVVAAIGVGQASLFMRDGIEFRPDILYTVFAVVAVGFVILTLPMGVLFGWLSQRLAVRR